MQASLTRGFFFVVICLILSSLTFAADRQQYVGKWKVEKMMATNGKDWKNSFCPTTFQFFPNGKLLILMSTRPVTRITGTWKVLEDGRLQVSEEQQDGDTFNKPSISIFSLENGKLSKPAKEYMNENEKAQLGIILRKVSK